MVCAQRATATVRCRMRLTPLPAQTLAPDAGLTDAGPKSHALTDAPCQVSCHLAGEFTLL